MTTTANGARESRQTIFFPRGDQSQGGERPPEEPVRAEPTAQGEIERPAESLLPAARFTWMRELAPTADCVVFRGEEAQSGNLVTVELLNETAARNPRKVKLFYLEAEAASRLQHPQIARAFAAEAFAVSHLRRASHLPGGRTLREAMIQGGWFDPPRALRILTQVADALAYAHQAGVLHLNLQPEHILIDGQDRVLLTGFGIADDKGLEWARRLRAQACAPPYLSPEQFGGQPGDRASDLYALGAIFYEMLTDRVPFDSDDFDQVQLRHKTRTPRPPHELNHDLSPGLSEVVMELLSRKPEARLRKFDETDALKTISTEHIPSAVSEPERVRQRATIPMPLSELAAEINAPAAAEVHPAEVSEESPSRPSRSGLLERKRYLYQAVGAALAILLLAWFVVPAIQKWVSRGAGNKARQVDQISRADQGNQSGQQGQGGQAGSAQRVANDPARRTASLNSREPNLEEIYGPLVETSRTPAKNGRAENSASNNASGNEAGRSAHPTDTVAMVDSPVIEGPAKAGNFVFGAPVRRVSPIYPAYVHTRQAGEVVIVEVSVNERGNVAGAQVISGPGTLRSSAIAAARQWQFAPSTFNGKPVKVHRMITFHYNSTGKQEANLNRDRAQLHSQRTRGIQRRSGRNPLRPSRSAMRRYRN